MQEHTKKDENRFQIIEGKQRDTDITLDNHTEMLKDISSTVDRIEEIVASHSTMFTAHSKVLETLVTLGNTHTELLKQILEKLQ